MYRDSLLQQQKEWQEMPPEKREEILEKRKQMRMKRKEMDEERSQMPKYKREDEEDLDKEVVDALREMKGQKPLSQQRAENEYDSEDDESAFIQNLENQYG